jgi:AcrR family transcriptional regulator
MYPWGVPKLWTETIEEHRHDVRAAILEATWALVTEQGLTAVKMSQVAERTGIGRATLYNYFPDVESILLAWHERHVAHHLEQLQKVRDRTGDPHQRLEVVLTEYATIAQHRGLHALDLVNLLHQDRHVTGAQQQLMELICDLLTEAVAAGDVRDDIAPEELAQYCMHALTAASRLTSEAATARLVAVTLAGLRSPTER